MFDTLIIKADKHYLVCLWHRSVASIFQDFLRRQTGNRKLET